MRTVHQRGSPCFGEINRTRGIRAGVARETFEAWQAHAQSFQSLGALLDDQVFALPGNRESLHGARVSPGFFELLGVRPVLGRTFERGAENAVVISHEFWSSRWAGSPDVLGRTLDMSNRKWTVVGVMPPGFRLLYSSASVWVPLEPASGRGSRALFVVGRLRPSQTIEQATAELAGLRTGSDAEWTAWGKPLREYMVGERRPLAVLISLTVGLMLITACLNLGAVMIARATGRLKDVAIRVSLGAGTWQILRESLAEALILAAAGAAAGLALALAIRRIAMAALPDLCELTIDGTVLAFTCGLAVATALLIAFGPALLSTRALSSTAATRRSRLRGLFVIGQTALAVALLVSAGVLLRSLARLQSTQPGFSSSGVLVSEIELAPNATPERASDFVRRVLEKAASEPYVRSAAAATAMPLFNPGPATATVSGREGTTGVARRSVSPDYFALFGMPLRLGRAFTSADHATAPHVAVVNERAAQLLWPGKSPIGERIHFAAGPWITVVGVAANAHSVGLRRPPIPEIFLPFEHYPSPSVSLALLVEGDPLASLPALAAITAAADPRAGVKYANSMTALLDEQLALVRALSLFAVVFAGIAVLLAGTGLYGSISCLYAQRTREIGIRIALGATQRGIVRMVAASSAKLAAAGCVAGMFLGAAAGRLFQVAMFGIGTVDAAVLAGAALVTVLVVIAATYAPAARAARVEPATAIRCE